MKTLILVLVVATTGLAVASVQLYRQASSERARAETEVALRHKQEARIHELEKAQASLEQQLIEAQRTQAIPATPSAVAKARPASSPAFEGVVSRLERRDGEGAGFTTLPRRMRGPMESEAGRRFMQTQMRGSIRRQYQDVGRELDLPQEQANKLLDLLVEQQTRPFTAPRPASDDRAARMQAWQDIQAQNNKEIAALIGDSKMAEWKTYQQTLPQRAEVDSMGQQLENAGVPLSAEQRTQLVSALVEETQANPRPNFAPGLAAEEVQKQMNDWQDTYEKGVSDRARQVLTAEQFERYQDYTAWMAEMRKNLPRPVRYPNGNGAAVGSFQWAAPANAIVIAPAPPPSRQ